MKIFRAARQASSLLPDSVWWSLALNASRIAVVACLAGPCREEHAVVAGACHMATNKELPTPTPCYPIPECMTRYLRHS